MVRLPLDLHTLLRLQALVRRPFLDPIGTVHGGTCAEGNDPGQ